MYETNVRLVCDQCKTASEEFDGAIFTKGMVLSELRSLGWIRRRGNHLFNAGDYCPSCNPDQRKAGA